MENDNINNNNELNQIQQQQQQAEEEEEENEIIWPNAQSIEEKINNDIESLKRENIIEDLRVSIRYIIYTLITLPENNQTLYESSFGVSRLCMSIEKLLINNLSTTTTTSTTTSPSLWNIITILQNEYNIIDKNDFDNIKHHYSLLLTDNGRSRSYIRHLLNQKKIYTFFNYHKQLLFKENSILIKYYNSNSVVLDSLSMSIVLDILKKVDDNKFSLIVNSSSFDTLIDHSIFNSFSSNNNNNNNNNNNKENENGVNNIENKNDNNELKDINEIVNSRNSDFSKSPVIIPTLIKYSNNNNNNKSIIDHDDNLIISQFESPLEFENDSNNNNNSNNKSSILETTKKLSNLEIESSQSFNNNKIKKKKDQEEDEINYSDLLDQNFQLSSLPNSNSNEIKKEKEKENEDEINYSDLLDQNFNNDDTTFKTNAFNSNNLSTSSVSSTNFPSPSNFNVQLPVNQKYLYEDDDGEDDDDIHNNKNNNNNNNNSTTINNTTTSTTTIIKKTKKVVIKKKIKKVIPLERDIEL